MSESGSEAQLTEVKVDKEEEEPHEKKHKRTSKKSAKGKERDVKKPTHKKSFTEDMDIKKQAEIIQKKLEKLETSSKGLTTEEATKREEKWGRNEIEREKAHPILQFLKSLWNPLAWLMEIAVIVSIVLGDYADFGLVLGLLIINATITFVESKSASSAIEALMKSLAPSCICIRDGEPVNTFSPADLVPGDVVILRNGNIVPADCMLLEGGEILVDQSAITGESLPTDKGPASKVLSGSIVRRGEIKALVTRTGKRTVFGKAAQLTQAERKTSQFQKILSQVSWFCITFIVIGVIIELAVQFGGKRYPCRWGDCRTINNALVLIVGGIPVAMPTVLSITLAIGAYQLAHQGAVISRLSAIENLSGMDILCSDKTGTLTKNELSITDPETFSKKFSAQEMIFLASISAPPNPTDPIDIVLYNSLTDEQKERYKLYSHIKYTPFDPVTKITEAKIKGPNDEVFTVRKGAPQKILQKSANHTRLEEVVQNSINNFGKKGYRTIGVSRSEDGKSFKMLGLIPLFDPPRDDTKEMIEKTKSEGIEVKMVTGDQLAIAQETARQLGLNPNVVTGEFIRDKQKTYKKHGVLVHDIIEDAGGFAEVFPEDKYYIVNSLHKRGHTVGMTGDGVNDTAALKKSDIGIAVAGATDAARSAADIVLLNPGLSVIVDAIIGSRKIFQRMKSYCIYSISMAVRTVVAFVILTTVYDWYFPTIAIAILAILNDGCMISISRDRVTPSPLPDKWNPYNIFGSAVFYGCYLGISTIILFEVAVNTNFFQDTFGLATLNVTELVGLIYTQISVGGLATIFITRSYSFSFLDRPGLFVVGAFIFAQAIASVLGAYGLNGYNGFGGAGWGYVLVAWVWSIIWYIPLDCAKAAFRAIKETPLWKEWVDIEMGSLHPFGKKQLARLVQHTHISMNKNKHKKVHDTTQQYYTSSDDEGEGEGEEEVVKP